LAVRLEGFLRAGIKDRSMVPRDTLLIVWLLLGMMIWLPKWLASVDDLTGKRLFDPIMTFSLIGLSAGPITPRSG
jgi:hypothetical protein